MYLLIGCLSGAMLVQNKFGDAHAPGWMIVVSLDGDIHQPGLSILLAWTLQHVVL